MSNTRKQNRNDVEIVVDSFNNGVLDIVSIWLLFCGVVLFLGVVYGDSFLIAGWIFVSIIAIIWIVVRCSRKAVSQVQNDPVPTEQSKRVELAISIDKLDGVQQILNACDHASKGNERLMVLCDKLRETINWIRNNNTTQHSAQIDKKLQQLEIDSLEAMVLMSGN
jgi:hypothetical protein